MKKMKRTGLIVALALVFVLSLAVMTACNDPTVTSISVKEPNVVEYTLGSDLKLDGGEITVKWSDNTETTVSLSDNNVTCSPMSLTTVGEAIPITVTYKDKTATFTVKVVAVVDKIEVTTKPKTTGYFTGDAIEFTGGKVTISYLAGAPSEEYDITDARFTINRTVIPYDSTDDLTVRVTLVADPAKTATYTITGIQQASITSISVSEYPEVSGVYVLVGNTIDLSSGKVLLTNLDGSTDEISMADSRLTVKMYELGENLFDDEYVAVGEKLGEEVDAGEAIKKDGFKIIRVIYNEAKGQFVEFPAIAIDFINMAYYFNQAYTLVSGLAKETILDSSNLLMCYYLANELLIPFQPGLATPLYDAVSELYPQCEYDFEELTYGMLAQDLKGSYGEGLSILKFIETVQNFIYGRYEYYSNASIYPAATRWGLLDLTVDSPEFLAFIDLYVNVYIQTSENINSEGVSTIENVDTEGLLAAYLALNLDDRYKFLTIMGGKNYEYNTSKMLSYDPVEYKTKGINAFFVSLFLGGDELEKEFPGEPKEAFKTVYAFMLVATEIQTLMHKLYSDISVHNVNAAIGISFYSQHLNICLSSLELIYPTLSKAARDEIDRLFPGLADSLIEDFLFYQIYSESLYLEQLYALNQYDPLNFILQYMSYDYFMNSIMADIEIGDGIMDRLALPRYAEFDGEVTLSQMLNVFKDRYNELMGKLSGSSEATAFINELIVAALTTEAVDRQTKVADLYISFLGLDAEDKLRVFSFLDSNYGEYVDISFFDASISLYEGLFLTHFDAIVNKDYNENDMDSKYYDIAPFLKPAMLAIEHSAAFRVKGNAGNRFIALDNISEAISAYNTLITANADMSSLAALRSVLDIMYQELTALTGEGKTVSTITNVTANKYVYNKGEAFDKDEVFVEVVFSDSTTGVLRLSDARLTASAFSSSTVGEKTIEINNTYEFKVYVMDLTALTDAMDSTLLYYIYYTTNGNLDTIYNYYVKNGKEATHDFKYYSDTTRYVISFRAFESKYNEYIALINTLDAKYARDIERLIFNTDREYSIYSNYQMFVKFNSYMDGILNNPEYADLKDFYNYYINDCAPVYLANTTATYATMAKEMLDKFVALSLTEQYLFMTILDRPDYANYAFVAHSATVSNGYVHFYSPIFNGDDNNIFSSIMFDAFYKANTGMFADLANRVLLLIEMRATYFYLKEAITNETEYALRFYQYYTRYAQYYQEFEFPKEENMADVTATLANAKFIELFGRKNIEGDLLYDLLQFTLSGFYRNSELPEEPTEPEA